jgi:hypothetical protein
MREVRLLPLSAKGRSSANVVASKVSSASSLLKCGVESMALKLEMEGLSVVRAMGMTSDGRGGVSSFAESGSSRSPLGCKGTGALSPFLAFPRG